MWLQNPNKAQHNGTAKQAGAMLGAVLPPEAEPKIKIPVQVFNLRGDLNDTSSSRDKRMGQKRSQ